LKREQGHEYNIDHHGDYFYIHSNKNAKNFALWRSPLHPTPATDWEVVIPHDINVCIEGFSCFKTYLVISQRTQGLSELKVYPDEGTPYLLPMPESVYNIGMGTNWEFDTNQFRYCYQSMTTPPSTFLYDVEHKTSTLLKQEPVLGDYRSEQYEAKRLHAKAPDGTEIPISLVYKKSLHRPDMPVYLIGYGAYGIDMDPWFSYARISLLERGFIFAIAHIRGGGDLGEPWHDAGKLMNKKTSFSDFIACSRYLIDEKITSPQHLFINGGSAGGLLMGAVLNEAPELYRGAVVQVPFVDVLNTMLDDTLPLTVHEYEEWGNPNERQAYDYIKSYSPYDNIKPQAYPALFITGGLHDPRVAYWEPAKWCAKLREHQTGNNPILLKIQMSAGHGGLSGRYEALKEVAEEFAFILGMLEGKIAVEIAI
jgi:oligopeptidase B